DGELRAHGVSLDDVKRKNDCPFARVGGAELRAHVAGAGANEPSASVEGAVDDAVVRWGDVTLSGSAALDVVAERAPRRFLEATALATGVRLRGGDAANARWAVRVPRASVKAELEGSEGSLRGPIRVDAKEAAGAIGKVHMHGDVSAALRVAAVDVAGRRGVA